MYVKNKSLNYFMKKLHDASLNIKWYYLSTNVCHLFLFYYCHEKHFFPVENIKTVEERSSNL